MSPVAIASNLHLEDELPFGEEPLNNANAQVYEFPQGEKIEFADENQRITFTPTSPFWSATVFDIKKGKVVDENSTVNKVELYYQVSGENVYFFFVGKTLIGNDVGIRKVVSKKTFTELFGFEAKQSLHDKSSSHLPVRLGIGDIIARLIRK